MRGAMLPFAMRRVVSWGDCDPAKIIYGPRALHFVMEAVEAWHREVVGTSCYALNTELGMGHPTVRAEIDYLRPLRADQEIAVRVRVAKVGRSSVTYHVSGGDDDGNTYFLAVLVACYVSEGEGRAVAIPERFRRRVAAYRKACGDE